MKKSKREATTIWAVVIIFSVVIAAGGAFYSNKARAKRVVPVSTLQPTSEARPPIPSAPAEGVVREVETIGHPSIGVETAPVTIVEFSDFECPFCAQATPVLARLQEAYPGKIRRVFRQFPLASIHSRAVKASEASLCAFEQGRFWQYHPLLFERPAALEFADLVSKARSAGLDMKKFGECFEAGRYAGRVQSDLKEGVRLGVSGTPSFVINGKFYPGFRPFENLVQIVERELAAR